MGELCPVSVGVSSSNRCSVLSVDLPCSTLRIHKKHYQKFPCRNCLPLLVINVAKVFKKKVLWKFPDKKPHEIGIGVENRSVTPRGLVFLNNPQHSCKLFFFFLTNKDVILKELPLEIQESQS